MIIALLLACTDPGPAALRTCELSPGLSIDAQGLALLEPLLVLDELAVLRGATPTEGHTLLGDAGLARIRKGTSCELGPVESAGSGRWAVSLTRTGPRVTAAGVLGPPESVELSWQVVSSDGLRVETGLTRAASMRASAVAAVEEGDLMRAASTLRALARSYPDPTLTIDIALADAAQEKADYASQLSHVFVSAEGSALSAPLTNRGTYPLASVTAVAIFEGSSEVPVELGAVAAGATIEYAVPIPADAVGKVKLETRAYELATE